MSLEPGIHDAITATDYHDGGTTPMLSASIARILVNKSPAHAKAAHPVLNPEREREESTKYDLGTSAHALLLQGDDIIETIIATDWRTKEAKEARDDARAAGKIPLLLEQAGDVRSMVAEAKAQLKRHRATPPLFADGKPEQTLVWEDDFGVVCCARLDWLRDDYQAVDDLKSTSRSADPAAWAKRCLFPYGYALQARFYQRGVRILTGIEPQFRFAVVETEPPYALSVVSLAPSAEAIADSQIDHALATWGRCLESGEWPSYTTDVAFAEVPSWVEMDWAEREVQAA